MTPEELRAARIEGAKAALDVTCEVSGDRCDFYQDGWAETIVDAAFPKEVMPDEPDASSGAHAAPGGAHPSSTRTVPWELFAQAVRVLRRCELPRDYCPICGAYDQHEAHCSLATVLSTPEAKEVPWACPPSCWP